MAEESTSDRRIEIQHDALGSAIVSGDGNKVVVYHYHLAQALQGSPLATAQSIGANPYRGLAAFQVEDAAVYFGREVQIDRLWNRLRDIQERTDPVKTRLLPILGASGSGKSSLVRAGLLPELARRSLPGYRQAQVAVMTPGATPLESLSVVLARIATQDLTPVEKAQEFERVLRQGNDQNSHNFSDTHHGLRRIANALPGIEVSPLIVLVDQFEEVYSLCKDPSERTAFINNLLDAASNPARSVLIVLTLRSDFLGETQQHPRLDQLIGSDQSVIVPAMTTEELRRAIAEPAKQAGHPFEAAMVDLLIKDTEGREGALPLLQFALTKIWEGLENNVSPMETLKAIGGVGGALAGEAQRIYRNLGTKEQDIARRLFVGLVQLGKGTPDTRKRGTTVESLIGAKDAEGQVRQVLDRFSVPGARLITLSAVDGKEIAEITHEALFDQWEMLRRWLKDDRPFLTWKDRLQAAIQQWKINDQDPAALLRGKPLDEAKYWSQERENDLNQEEQKFIQAGLQERDRIEEERLQLEVRHLEQLLAEEEKARRAESKRVIAVFLSASVVLITIGSFVSVDWQRREQFQRLSYDVWSRFKVDSSDPKNLNGLNSFLEEAQSRAEKYQKSGDVERSLAYYRQIRAETIQALDKAVGGDSEMLQRLLAKTPGKEQEELIKNSKFQTIFEKAQKSEMAIAEILEENPMKKLAIDLKAGVKEGSFGEIRPGSSPRDFENQYKPGALQTTYKMLMRDWGAGADLNNDGRLNNDLEALQIPCDTLQDIEDLWRKITKRCDWYDLDPKYLKFNSDDKYMSVSTRCTEFNGNTLSTMIFNLPGGYPAVTRLKACKVDMKK